MKTKKELENLFCERLCPMEGMPFTCNYSCPAKSFFINECETVELIAPPEKVLHLKSWNVLLEYLENLGFREEENGDMVLKGFLSFPYTLQNDCGYPIELDRQYDIGWLELREVDE